MRVPRSDSARGPLLAEDRLLDRSLETAGIGVAVVLGIGLGISAVAGTILMVLMYLAELPFAIGGASTNPAVDYHIIYALALIVVAATAAGDTWGLGRWWKTLPFVRTHRWLH
jgi:thiosulfate dehydrogenase (quinone) large subunit